MASMKRPRLKAVKAHADYKLALTFVDDRRFMLDMSQDVKNYPGLTPLLAQQNFAGATMGDEGWIVEWPAQDIQIGADTLLLDALAQSAPDEDTRTFIGWRATTGFSLKQAAVALGVAPRTISRYSSGRELVPHTLALACRGWQAIQAEQPHKRT